MTRTEVICRTAVFGLALGMAAPVMAQETQPPPPPPAPSMPAPETIPSDPVKPQVMIYESALRQAVDGAGQKLAMRAQAVAPQVVLEPDRVPDVRGIHLPDYGFYFDVLIPDINPVALRVIDMMRKNPLTPPLSMPVGTATARQDQKVSATKVVEGDPMTATPAPTLATFEPTKDYSAFSREAILDALVDLSGILPIKADEWLTISASGFPIANVNPLYQQSANRKLMVKIKGSDLLEFRQGKISRDEAKARIKEWRY